MELGMIVLGRMRTSLVRFAAPHESFADKLLSVIRSLFGGHTERNATPKGDAS
jgi:hypothetical protein